MTMKRAFFVSLFVFSFAAACEEEDPRASNPADANQTALLQTAVNDIGTIGTIADDPATNAGSAQGTLSNLYGSYDGLVNSVMAAQAAEEAGIVQQGETVACGTGSYTYDDASVLYEDCNGLSGTIEWSGDSFTMDITFDFSAYGGGMYTGQMTYAGTMTITDTQIDGALDLAYQFAMSYSGYDINYDSSYGITYDAVGLDASGCPESGSLDVEGTWAYSASGQDYNESFHITAEFNACDDVTMYY
jgi:hypothetical protein